MTAASRSLATALSRARFASGLLQPTYTTNRDTTFSSLLDHGLSRASTNALSKLRDGRSPVVGPEEAYYFSANKRLDLGRILI